MKAYSKAYCIAIAWLCGQVITTPGTAAPLEQALKSQVQLQQEAATTQQQVDTLAEQTHDLVEEYRKVLAANERLDYTNQQLQRQLDYQQQALADVVRQIQAVEVLQHESIPFLHSMVETLARFVRLDTPFLAQERTLRIRQLYALLDNPQLSIADRYRRIMEAYQVEMTYGHTIEAYDGPLVESVATHDLPTTQTPPPTAHITPATTHDASPQRPARMVQFLRLGRVALYYLTLDGDEAGYWDNLQRKWQSLPQAFRPSLHQAFKVVRKQIAPQWLYLALPAPLSENSQ